MYAGCAGKTEIPWERVTLEVWSRQGAIQIHVYLYLTLKEWCGSCHQGQRRRETFWIKRASSRDWPSLVRNSRLPHDASVPEASQPQRWCSQRRSEWWWRTNFGDVWNYVNHIADDYPRERCWCRKLLRRVSERSTLRHHFSSVWTCRVLWLMCGHLN